MKTNAVIGATLVGAAQAQSSAWAQCGGNGFSGDATCVSGYSCTYVNDWYSQCQPGSSGNNPPPASSTLVTVTTPATTSAAATPTSGTSGKFKWFGINQSGAEFGDGKFPGVLGTDYTWPTQDEISTLISQGYNVFRVPFLEERLAPNGLAGSFDSAYLSGLTSTISFITSKGASAVVDPHNYGRYRGSIVTSTADFKTFWTNLAGQFKSNSQVIFDTNNEYNGMDESLVVSLNQAAIDGIRAAGATSQYIFAEGNQWTGAWSWLDVNDAMKGLTDPQNKLVYEMHQYLDSDSSGTNANCVSSTIGVERVTNATQWLRANGKKGFLGEFAGGANSVCQGAVTGMLDYLQANSDVWTGASWWAGGPWWGDYWASMSPGSAPYTFWNPILKKYTA